MNFGRVVVAALAAWGASMVLGYLANDVLLADVYAEHAPIMRPPARSGSLLPFGVGLMLVGFLAFTYAYAKGYEGGSGVQEGLRFGVLVGLMLLTFSIVWRYVMFPISARLLLAWAVDVIVQFAVYGMIVGAIYRPHPRP